MNNLDFVAPLLALSGVAVIVLGIIAVVQDIRQERKYGYRQAFYTIVTLVMLVMSVGSGISLMVVGLKEAIPSARTYNARLSFPPSPFLTGVPEKGLTTAYTCTDTCEFTALDKQNFTDWKNQYQTWRDSENLNLQLRRDLAGGLALFLVAVPLYLLFSRWMNRGAKQEIELHQRPSPLRSVYFYGVAFGSLVLAVVGAAFVINTGLKVWLKTDDTSRTLVAPTPAVTTVNTAADSIIACASKCGFTTDDVALVKDWKSMNDSYTSQQQKNTGSAANEVANTIPYIVFGVPLFWYHFTRIRKDSGDKDAKPQPTTT